MSSSELFSTVLWGSAVTIMEAMNACEWPNTSVHQCGNEWSRMECSPVRVATSTRLGLCDRNGKHPHRIYPDWWVLGRFLRKTHNDVYCQIILISQMSNARLPGSQSKTFSLLPNDMSLLKCIRFAKWLCGPANRPQHIPRQLQGQARRRPPPAAPRAATLRSLGLHDPGHARCLSPQRPALPLGVSAHCERQCRRRTASLSLSFLLSSSSRDDGGARERPRDRRGRAAAAERQWERARVQAAPDRQGVRLQLVGARVDAHRGSCSRCCCCCPCC